MKKYFAIIAAILTILAALFAPKGTMAAFSNNLWSLNVVHRLVNSTDPIEPNIPNHHAGGGLILARHALKNDDPQKAEILIRPSAQKKDTIAMYALAEALFEQGKYEEALAIWRSLENDNPLRYAAAGIRNRNPERLDLRLKAYQLAAELRPTLYAESIFSTTLQFAKSLRDAGQITESLPYYQNLVEKYPGKCITYFELAKTYDLLEELSLAIISIERGISCSPQDLDFYFLAGELYSKAENPSKALEVYQKVLTINPGNETAIEFIQQLSDKLP